MTMLRTLSVCWLLIACSVSAPERAGLAAQLARGAHMRYQAIQTERFVLASWQRINRPGAPVTVYIEGDGFAWESRTQPAADPTPLNPIALRLAARDPSENVVYLARPCQFEGIRSPACAPLYWTEGRFSRHVVNALDTALTHILREAHAEKLHLVGYSGGGGLAVLVAAQRSDVLDIRTVAGNLDHRAWTAWHQISPLTQSENPIAVAHLLEAIPQRHFIGASDEVVPRAIAESYRTHMANPAHVTLTSINGADHQNGWEAQWPTLLALPVEETSAH